MSGSLVSLRLCAAVVALAICLRPQPSAAAPAASDAVGPVTAQVEPVGRSADPLPGLEAFVDGVTANLAQQHIAGVQLAIVKDGQARLIKGYGLGALEPERPVNPERTLFHLASISKTFTWLAIMQLVDRGKLRLEDPVNDHLPADLAIPSDGWDEPVRVITSRRPYGSSATASATSGTTTRSRS